MKVRRYARIFDLRSIFVFVWYGSVWAILLIESIDIEFITCFEFTHNN